MIKVPRSIILAYGVSLLVVGLAVLSQLSAGLLFPMGMLLGLVAMLAITIYSEAMRRARKTAEAAAAALKESEQRYRGIVETSSVGICLTDAHMRTEYVNPRMADMLDYTVEEMIGKSVLNFIDHSCRRQAGYNFERCKDGMKEQADLCYLHKNGSRCWAMVSSSPILSPRGEFTGQVSIITDVTGRMRAERERARLLAREQQARREAEAASRDKDDLLAMVAHDLRVPLGGILGWIQLLRLEKTRSKDFVQGLDGVERNATLQARLLDDLLDVSRIANGSLQLDRRVIKLSSVVERAIDTVGPVADEKGIWLQTALDPDADDLFGDPNRLQQVVWNLLTNAIKFTPDGGQILISARRAGGNVQLAVSDTGKGISPDFLPYVFDRFKQGDASAERTGGLGLGLAIARHIVEMHGGTIRAYSEGPEHGAVFTVELPHVAVHSQEEFSSNSEMTHSYV